jgi:hypothetical protein
VPRRLTQRSFVACLLLALSILSAEAQQKEEASQLNSGQNATNTTAGEAPREKPRSVGSPYVELDSWIYPAIERLAALGYIHTQFLGMRPWTRLECALSVQEAGEEIVGIFATSLAYLFTTRAGRVLDPRDSLKALHGDVFTAPLDGSQPVPFALNQGFKVDGPIFWGPDGDRVIFYGYWQDQTERKYHWWIVPLVGNKPIQVELPGRALAVFLVLVLVGWSLT